MDENEDHGNFVLRKERSSTFGEYESVVRGDKRQQHLVISPVRSLVSGGDVPLSYRRRRSETWHGGIIKVNQVVPRTEPSLKDILQEIITNELWVHLGDDCELKSSEEFVEKSSIISKAIGERARVVIDSATKVVSCVYLGEIRGDGIEITSRCLLDVDQDVFACGNLKTATIFAVGTLFVIPSS